MSNTTAHFTTTDSLGNTYHIYVKADGSVEACNERRIRTSLDTFSATSSRAAARSEIRDAARLGLQALNCTSFDTWTLA